MAYIMDHAVQELVPAPPPIKGRPPMTAPLPGPTVRQSDLIALRQAWRLIGHPTVARVARAQQGGGFGDQTRHPHAWAVFVQIDGLSTRVTSARGLGGSGRAWIG